MHHARRRIRHHHANDACNRLLPRHLRDGTEPDEILTEVVFPVLDLPHSTSVPQAALRLGDCRCRGAADRRRLANRSDQRRIRCRSGQLRWKRHWRLGLRRPRLPCSPRTVSTRARRSARRPSSRTPRASADTASNRGRGDPERLKVMRSCPRVVIWLGPRWCPRRRRGRGHALGKNRTAHAVDRKLSPSSGQPRRSSRPEVSAATAECRKTAAARAGSGLCRAIERCMPPARIELAHAV